MIEEDVTIARWGFAAMLVFASLMAAAFVCWLHEHGIHPSKPVLKFLLLVPGQVLRALCHHHYAVLLLQAVAADGDAAAD